MTHCHVLNYFRSDDVDMYSNFQLDTMAHCIIEITKQVVKFGLDIITANLTVWFISRTLFICD